MAIYFIKTILILQFFSNIIANLSLNNQASCPNVKIYSSSFISTFKKLNKKIKV